MISLVLQHLENLHVELMEIDPAHRTDAADTVAALASDLRRILAEPRHAQPEPAFEMPSYALQAVA
jgi:hypothetical protein